MLLENADYFVRIVDFPIGADGAVIPNDDGTFSVYLDANLSDDRRKVAMDHELIHMERDHFYTDAPVAQVEAEANTIIEKPISEKCAKPEQNPVEKCEWLSSWQKAMLWAETMQALYGESDRVPLYTP